MNRTLNAILGITLIITGVGGMLFSIAGIAGVWYFRPQALENLTANLQLASNALTTTSEGLEVANSSLSMTIESLDRLDQAITASGEALDSTTPMITSLTTLTRSELPATVETARTSLSSAQESARIIDSFLSALSFLPGIDYNPEVPLNESLAAVAASLDPIPESLETIETSLDTTGDNLQAIQSDMELMAADVREIRSGLQEAEQVIDRYQGLTGDLQVRVDRTQRRLPTQVRAAAWALTFALIWAFFTQVSVLVQGFTLLRSRD